LPDTLAFVVPWFGTAATGGAEAECRATAKALQARGLAVEILTTCALSHAGGWTDHHPEGVSEEDGITVRRFRVRPRDPARYARGQSRLRLGGRLQPWEEREFVKNSIHSDGLYAYLGAERHRYWYAFIPYCFGTSWEGALAASERAVLIPCLHDEPFAYLGATARLLREARAVFFHVPAERALATRVAGGDPGTFFLVGEGVDTEAAPGDAARFREKYRVDTPFLLYAGRKVEEKNVPLLLDYFARYRLTHPSRPLRLILIGGDQLRIPERLADDIRDLGFLPAQDRLDAYAAALALCQPSLLESFSIVLMEAWLAGIPVLVHDASPVTKEHCLASNGGLLFGEYFEFVEAVELLLDDAGLRDRLGANGRAYVKSHFTWDRVTASYLDALSRLGARLP
jgi:glycosyltransferase involved in cell wall biosynthesis